MATFFPVKDPKTGVTDEIEAPDEATAKSIFKQKLQSGAYRSSGENIARGAQATRHGFRGGVEGIAGLGGDLPGMVGGATSWAANKIPTVTDEQAASVGQAIEQPVRAGIKAVTGGYAADVILKALSAAGIISPETAQAISAETEPPSSADIHGITSAVLPESVDRSFDMPPDPTAGEKAASFAGGMMPNLIGGPSGGVKQALTRFGTRVAAPTVVESAVDPITEKLIAAKKITPEDAVAIKTLVQGVTGGVGGVMEKGLSQRQAASLVTQNPDALRAVYDGLIADGMDPATAEARIAELGGGRAAGGEAMITDLGEHGNIEQMGVKAGVSPGPGGAELKRKLEERSDWAGERIRAGQEATVGAPVNRDVELERFKKRAGRVGSQYDLAKQNQARPVDTGPIATELETELGRARRGMRGELKKLRADLDLPDAPGHLDPSAEGLHEVRMALDTRMKDVKKGTPLFAKLTSYRKAIDEELKSAAPDIARLDERLSRIKGEQEAYLTGEQGPKKPVEGGGAIVASDAEFKTTWDAMEPREKQAMQRGTSRWLDQQTGMTDRERVKLKSALAGDWNEAKLKTQFGDQKIDDLKAMLEREDIFQERRNVIVHGSKTAQAVTPGEPGMGQTSPVQTGAFATVATGSTTAGLAAGGIQAAKNWIGKRLSTVQADQRLKSDIGKLLAHDSPEDVFRAMEMLRKADSSAIMPRAMQTALTARMAETGHR